MAAAVVGEAVVTAVVVGEVVVVAPAVVGEAVVSKYIQRDLSDGAELAASQCVLRCAGAAPAWNRTEFDRRDRSGPGLRAYPLCSGNVPACDAQARPRPLRPGSSARRYHCHFRTSLNYQRWLPRRHRCSFQ